MSESFTDRIARILAQDDGLETRRVVSAAADKMATGDYGAALLLLDRVDPAPKQPTVKPTDLLLTAEAVLARAKQEIPEGKQGERGTSGVRGLRGKPGPAGTDGKPGADATPAVRPSGWLPVLEWIDADRKEADDLRPGMAFSFPARWAAYPAGTEVLVRHDLRVEALSELHDATEQKGVRTAERYENDGLPYVYLDGDDWHIDTSALKFVEADHSDEPGTCFWRRGIFYAVARYRTDSTSVKGKAMASFKGLVRVASGADDEAVTWKDVPTAWRTAEQPLFVQTKQTELGPAQGIAVANGHVAVIAGKLLATVHDGLYPDREAKHATLLGILGKQAVQAKAAQVVNKKQGDRAEKVARWRG